MKTMILRVIIKSVLIILICSGTLAGTLQAQSEPRSKSRFRFRSL